MGRLRDQLFLWLPRLSWPTGNNASIENNLPTRVLVVGVHGWFPTAWIVQTGALY
jgi:hypothetical protein